MSKALGQIFIGGIVWLFYFAAVNALVAVGINHTVSEIAIIPISWIANYNLNRVYNFEVEHSFKRFVWFISISGFSWIPFLFASYAIADFFGAPLILAHGFGIVAKTVSNLILQHLITFKDSQHADNRA